MYDIVHTCAHIANPIADSVTQQLAWWFDVVLS